MDSEKLANYAQVFEAFVVAISIGFIWYQLRQQTKLAKMANTQAIFELSSALNLQVIQDKETAELIYNGHKNYDSFNDVKKFQYRGTLTWRLAFQRLIYFQHKNGLLDDSTYRVWETDFKVFIRRRHLALRWSELRPFYTPEFGGYVSKMIEEVELERKRDVVLGE